MKSHLHSFCLEINVLFVHLKIYFLHFVLIFKYIYSGEKLIIINGPAHLDKVTCVSRRETTTFFIN